MLYTNEELSNKLMNYYFNDNWWKKTDLGIFWVKNTIEKLFFKTICNIHRLHVVYMYLVIFKGLLKNTRFILFKE